MAHLYRMSEWEGCSGHWFVNDLEELSSVSSKWWTPVRMLGMTPNEYVLMLKNKFHANYISYTKESNVLIFSFKTQAEARVFKNYMNKEARKRNYICGK